MDEEASSGARAGVRILGTAPCCGVDIPVVGLQGGVADGAGEIPDDGNARDRA